MRLLRGLAARPFGACVASIGNFDGVHCGHQAMLKQLVTEAKRRCLPAVVIVFEPQPKEVLQPATAPVRLSRFREKWRQFAGLGVDAVLCLPFNARLCALTAAEFIQQVLTKRLDVRCLLVGADFRFGAKRLGTVATLSAAFAPTRDVVVVDDVLIAGERVSSTRVRLALQSGDLSLATQLLGREYSLFGKVIHGCKRGRTIGVPTANIALKRSSPPLSGVYCVRATVCGRTINGVANIGCRPTVDGNTSLLEVHLMDIELPLYQQPMEVVFLTKLRDEQRFSDFDALVKQIHADIAAARAFFNRPLANHNLAFQKEVNKS